MNSRFGFSNHSLRRDGGRCFAACSGISPLKLARLIALTMLPLIATAQTALTDAVLSGVGNKLGTGTLETPSPPAKFTLTNGSEFVVDFGSTFTAESGSTVDLFHATLALPEALTLKHLKLAGASNQLLDGATLSLLSGSAFTAAAGSTLDLSAAAITFPATVVLTTGSQTLTGKTLVSPTISSIAAAAGSNLTLSGGDSGASVTAQKGTDGNVVVTPSGSGTLVFSPPSDPTNLSFQLGGGTWWTSGVPYIRPTKSGSPGILDVLANGSGQDSWVDIGTDYVSDRPNGEFIQVKKAWNSYGSITVKGLGSGSNRHLVLQDNDYNVVIGTEATNSFVAGSGLKLSSRDQRTALQQDTYNSAGGFFMIRRARGSYSAPSGVLAEDSLSAMFVRGFRSDATWSSTVASFQSIAAENFTGASNGTHWTFSTTPIGSTTVQEAARVTSQQNLLIGGTTDISGRGGLKIFGTSDNTANSANTGALQVLGGASISKSLNVLGGRTSTSTTTGDLVVSGGAGVGGPLYLGGRLVTAGGVLNTATTASTSTSSGALVVAGGAGISGNAHVGGTINASNAIIQGSDTSNSFAAGSGVKISNSGGRGALQLDTYDSTGAGGSLFMFRRARGTLASPSAVQANDVLSSMQGRGYGDDQFGTTVVAIEGYAGETFTNTRQGTYIAFTTTPIGSIARAEAARITSRANLLVGGTSDIPGAGGLKVFGTTSSISTTTGALVVGGGAGIGGHANIGGDIKAAGAMIQGSDSTNTFVAGSGIKISNSGARGAVQLDTYDGTGVGGSLFMFRRARGTLANPTAIQANDVISSMQGRGYGANQFGTTTVAIQGFAAENFTDIAQGTYIALSTTPIGSSAAAEAVRVTSQSNLLIGGTSEIAGSGGLKVFGTMPSTSTSTGSAVFSGGIGVAGQTSTASLNVGNGTTLTGLVSTIVSLDFPAIDANGGVQDLAVTVPGAATGNDVRAVEAGGTFINPGIIIRAIVTAPNAVTIRATNCTAGAIDPIAISYRVTVSKF